MSIRSFGSNAAPLQPPSATNPRGIAAAKGDKKTQK